MPLSFYPAMDDRDHANQLHTIPPSVLSTNHGTAPADHGIPIAPPSPDKSEMLLPPSPSTTETEMDGCNIGWLLIDLATDGSEDGTGTPTEEEASPIPPEPTQNVTETTPPAPADEEAGTLPPSPPEIDAGTIPPTPTQKETNTTLPAPTEKESGTTPPAPTEIEACTTREKPTHPKQKGTQ